MMSPVHLRVADLLEDLIKRVDELTTKGLLPEGDIEGLERAAGEAQLFLEPQEGSGVSYYDLPREPFNGLTPKQSEMLDMLSEECGEVIQAIGKIKRHGYESRHPHDPVMTNRMQLMKELGDVFGLVTMLEEAEQLNPDYIHEAADRALVCKPKYMHHLNDAE
jgi:NTP pyrophosphatase (non-canonical NTP hydrolase)